MAFKPGRPALIGVEFYRAAFVEAHAHQAGNVGEAEPGLAVVANGSQAAVVAEKAFSGVVLQDGGTGGQILHKRHSFLVN